MTYQLPEPSVPACRSVYDDHEPYFTAEQMQAAYQAGRDAMKAEVLELCAEFDESALAHDVRNLK